MTKNPFKPICKARPQSVDKTKYQGLSSDDYFKNKKDNAMNNNYYNNYRSSAFEAIINENIKAEDNNKNKKGDKISIPSGFDQINQLNEQNNTSSSGGITKKIRNIFGNFK